MTRTFVVVAAVALALLCGHHDTTAFAVSGTRDTVQSLALVGSTREPHSCVAVRAAAAYLLAPAHCLAQMLGPAEFVTFGFEPALPDASNGSDGGAELVGTFEQTTRVPIARIAYHPQFANASSSSNTVGVDDTLVELDWAVIELAAPLPVLEYSMTLDLKQDLYTETRRLASSEIGMLRIDRTTLDVRYVNDTLLLDADRCALFPSVAGLKDFLCAVPRRPEARVISGRTTSASYWDVLATIDPTSGFIQQLLGFGSSNVDAAPFRSFTIASAAVQSFIELSSNNTVVFTSSEIVSGDDVTTLSPSLGFVSGVRATRTGRNVCGGSLVSPTFVLTAAHCLDDIGVTLWVSVGSVYGAGDTMGEQIKVARVIKHPRFDRSSGRNDVALLELSYASIQMPITLLRRGATRPTDGTIFGYGVAVANDLSAPLSLVLQRAAVTIYATNRACIDLLQTDMDDSMLCALGNGAADACAGDSGGPLIAQASSGSAPTLVGVVSFGRSCGTGLPSVYADVAFAMAFIDSVIRGEGAEVATAAPRVTTASTSRPAAAITTTTTTPAATVAPGASSQPVSPTLAPSTLASTSTSSTPSSTLSTPSSTLSTPSSILTTNSPTTSTPSSTLSTSSAPTSTSTIDSAQSTSNRLVVDPSTLQPVREALVQFLSGDLSHVNGASTAKRFDNKTLVFASTARLDGIERVLTKFSDTALSQRSERFETASSAAAAWTSPSHVAADAQHYVC